MLQALKDFTVSVGEQSTIKHQTEAIRTEELANVLSRNLVFVPVEPGSPLYDETKGGNQYEIVGISNSGKTVTHYKLRTANTDATIPISDYIEQYVETGRIIEREDASNSTIHLVPMPVYPIAQYGGSFAPCVQLKDGHRALVTQTNIIKGVKMF